MSARALLAAALLTVTTMTDAAAQPALASSGWRVARPAGGPWPLAPGFYQIEAVHSGRCLVVAGTIPEVPRGGTRVPHLAQATCPAGGPARAFSMGQVQLVPAPGGAYALVPHAGDGCATVARGVVLGAAAIDVLPCDPFAPAPDQAFHVAYQRQAEDGSIVELRTANGECWDVRDASPNAGAELIRHRCTGARNQAFRLRFANVPSSARARAAAQAGGWFVDPVAQTMVSVAETPGVDLPGSDIDSFPVDDFAGCVVPCLANARCRSISLVQRGEHHKTRAYCWLKDAHPSPVANPRVSSARVRP
jgi:hypothetical protein